MNPLAKILKNRSHLYIGIFVYHVYFLLYYWSIDYLNFGFEKSVIWWSSQWQALLFKRVSLFLFEPIGLIQFMGIQVLISPVNILIGFFLGLLVFFNIVASIYIYSLPKQCRIDYKYNGLIGILPSFLTGFACCVPSVLIPLASILGSTTSFLTTIFQWFLPLSVLLLVYGVYRSYQVILHD